MEPAKEVKVDAIDVEGLEDIYKDDNSHITDSYQASNEADEGLNIKEAAKYYDLSVASIRLKIKLGEIPAIKISGKTGPEWCIFPNGIPENYQKDDSTVSGVYQHPDNSLPEDYEEPVNTVIEEVPTNSAAIEAFKQASINLNKTLEMQKELMLKIETLTYKNGYLESQVDEREEQLKLLPDLESQAEKAKQLEKERKEKEIEVVELNTKVSELEKQLDEAKDREDLLLQMKLELDNIKAKQEEEEEKKSKSGFWKWFVGKDN